MRDPIPEYLINNKKIIKWDVVDPKDQSLEFTRDIRDQILAKVRDLALDLGVNKV